MEPTLPGVANDNLTSSVDVTTASAQGLLSTSDGFLHFWSEEEKRGELESSGKEGSGGDFGDLSRPPFTGSRGHLASIDAVLQWVLIPAICLLGILGNALNILILTRQRVRRSVKSPDQAVHVGLVSLAVSDMVFCLASMPRAFVPEFQAQFEGHCLSLYYHVYSTGLISTFGLISTWLIIVTAAMRYIVICHPLLSRVTSSHKSGCLAIVLTCVLCTASNLPSFYLLSFRTVLGNGTSMSSFILVDLGPFSHNTGQGLAFLWTKAALSIFVPGLLLVFFNIRLIQALRQSDRLRQLHTTPHQFHRPSLGSLHHRHNQRHRHDGPMTSRRNRLTVTLVTVVVVFILLVFPGELLDFFVHLDLLHWTSVDRESVIASRMLLNTLQLINFAFNFVLYCTLNAQFRRALVHWCCHRLSAHVTRVIRGRMADDGKDVIDELNPAKNKKQKEKEEEKKSTGQRSDIVDGIRVVASHSFTAT